MLFTGKDIVHHINIHLYLHFHYVLSMGAVFALYSAWYFWIPKMLGMDYNKYLGKVHFWILFIGVNVTFFPQHFLGLQGMPRRISDYPDAFAGWNMVSSFGSIISVIATWLFLYVLYMQLVEGKSASRYPWLVPQFYFDLLQTQISRSFSSLEWGLNSPPKPHAFVSLPLQSKFGLLLATFFEKVKHISLIPVAVGVIFWLYYKLPFSFMLKQLDISFAYPFISSILAMIGVIVIGNIKGSKLGFVRVLITGFFAWLLPYLVIHYIRDGDSITSFVCVLSAFIFEASNISLPTSYKPTFIVRPSTSPFRGVVNPVIKRFIVPLPTSPNKGVMCMMESRDEAPMPAPGSSFGGSGAGGSGSGGSGGGGDGNPKRNIKHPVVPVQQTVLSVPVPAPVNDNGVGTYTHGNFSDALFGQLMGVALDEQRSQNTMGRDLNQSRFERAHWEWLRSRLEHDHNTRVQNGQLPQGRLTLHQLLRNSSLTNTKKLRDLLKNS